MIKTNKPRLRRDIQIVPVTIEGRQLLAFVDPFKIAGDGFAVERKLIPFLKLLDGSHDLHAIQVMLMRNQGQSLIPLSIIESLVDQLDRSFLLESERLHEKRKFIYDEFEKQSDRLPVLAGKSYESDRLPVLAGKSYESDPGLLSKYIENDLHLANLVSSNEDISGIIAPHIDISVANKVYVDLYRRLKGKHYDLVIIFGINHQGQEGLFSVSEKKYVTPFGTLETDREFITQLKKSVNKGTLSSTDFDHRTEHSIEFQTIFLKHYLGKQLKIIPVLCGGIHEFLFSGTNPFDDQRFMSMVDALQSLIASRGDRVLLVSGVDFSHVGMKFGHSVPADMILSEAKENDRKIISFLKNGEPEKIYENAEETRDQYNVCGLPSMLIFSSMLRNDNAELLAHETYNENSTNSAVTYASMLFKKKKALD